MNTKFHLTYLIGGDEYFGPNYGGATVNTVRARVCERNARNLGRLFKQMTFNVDLENHIIANVCRDKVNVNRPREMR